MLARVSGGSASSDDLGHAWKLRDTVGDTGDGHQWEGVGDLHPGDELVQVLLVCQSGRASIGWNGTQSLARTRITFRNVEPFDTGAAGSQNNATEFALPTGAGGFAPTVTGSFAGYDAGASTNANFQNAGTPDAACAAGGLGSFAIVSGSMTIAS